MIERVWLSVCYVLAGIISLVWLTLSHAYAAPTFPPLTGRVVDDAGVLSEQTKQQLTGILAEDQQKFGGRQIVIATLKSLQGYEIADYGYQLGRAWGIGQKGKDNGAIIIVVPTEHRVRIEVGYGLEGDLTDAQSRIIIEREMKPAFKKGDYNAGILAGTKAVLATLGNTNFTAPDFNAAQTRDDDERHSPGVGWIVFIIIMLVLFRGRMFWPLFFLGGFGGGGRGGWGGGGGWSGGSGGGGFSGGGGSFGGGGASGSW